MQPYLFPYIGYFQLISKVDVFVFYDDVNFIKRGWINRNKLLINGNEYLFSIPLQHVSQNKLIKDVYIKESDKWVNQFFTTLQQNYAKAPFFEEVFDLTQSVFYKSNKSIADLAINSISSITSYLELETEFLKSSEHFSDTHDLRSADRLIAITKKNGSNVYVNPIGGKKLYDKGYFLENGIKLKFIETQFQSVSNKNDYELSIIHLLMIKSREEVLELLNQYKLS